MNGCNRYVKLLQKNITPILRCGISSIKKSKLLNQHNTKRIQTFRNLQISSCIHQQRLRGTYLIDDTGSSDENEIESCNKFTERTHNCGELQVKHVGQEVILCGWLEFKRLDKFVIIRDCYGHTQLLIDENNKEIWNLLDSLPYESIIEAKGTVLKRSLNTVNKNMSTGEIEVLVKSVTVLNKASDNLPFNIREFQKAKEALRMQYRYLDLRFPEMQRNLRVRSSLLIAMRNFLHKCEFVDVETPTLFKATPGGAQEFVVPTRFPGQFYSLVQSPQQFKQMLMAGSIDRYYQIARCYRDEGSRSDRQPEFTQLDIEMSFTSREGVMALIEELLHKSWPQFLPSLPAKFPVFTYQGAMTKYGTDKPDLRYGFELIDCSSTIKSLVDPSPTEYGANGLFFPAPYDVISKRIKTKFNDLSKKYTGVRFFQIKATSRDDWIDQLSKICETSNIPKLIDTLRISEAGVLFFSCGNITESLSLLGNIRIDYINHLEENGIKIKKEEICPAWIIDFPLFEKDSTGIALQSTHHPFTAPHRDDMDLLTTTPLQVRAQAYDLVLNGNEIGGGSIRIHDPVLQETLFKMLNIEKESMQYMLDMLGSGCPPHGGIALGIDRLVATILKTTSIRDVIAFPKTFEGRDPMSGAPTPINEQDKKLYHIQIV